MGVRSPDVESSVNDEYLNAASTDDDPGRRLLGPGCALKGVTAKMSPSLSISGHTWVTESLKLAPRVKASKEVNDLNNLED